MHSTHHCLTVQIDKLIKAGADILAPIPIGPKRIMGTAVDYAYYMYNLDRRIAHMPYHALTHAERETFNARRKLLAHLGDILRTKAVEREKKRAEEEEMSGRRSAGISMHLSIFQNFLKIIINPKLVYVCISSLNLFCDVLLGK